MRPPDIGPLPPRGLLTGGIFLLCFRVASVFPSSPPALLAFSCLLVVISFIDIDFRIIPYRLSLGGLGLGLAFSPLRPSLGFVHAVVGALVGCGLIYAIKKSYELLRKGEGHGGGRYMAPRHDRRLLRGEGCLILPRRRLVIGCLVGIPMMLAEGEGIKYAIPFGPFLSAGAFLYAVAGDALIARFYALIDLLAGLMR